MRILRRKRFLFFVFALPLPLYARPYYAATKGVSCASCHVNPAGAGVRKPTPESPVKINDNINLGADLRAYFSKLDGQSSSFTVGPRASLYVLAEPVPSLSLVLQGNFAAPVVTAAEAYGIWVREEGFPFYVRAGRFFLPYGLQFDDPLDSTYIKSTPFAPLVGFSLAPSQSDTGIEVGLAPEKKYFVNLAFTNGQPATGADNSDSKAVTGRLGWIAESFMIGATALRNRTGGLATDFLAWRYGPIAWLRLGDLVLMGEGGFGYNRVNSTGARTDLRAVFAEADYKIAEGWLLKAKFEHFDPDLDVSGDDKRRIVGAVEWFPLEYLSLEGHYRLIREKPSGDKNFFALFGHLWF